MSLLGASWKQLSADEKQKYVEQAATDKERFLKEKAEFEHAEDRVEEQSEPSSEDELSATSA